MTALVPAWVAMILGGDGGGAEGGSTMLFGGDGGGAEGGNTMSLVDELG